MQLDPKIPVQTHSRYWHILFFGSSFSVVISVRFNRRRSILVDVYDWLTRAEPEASFVMIVLVTSVDAKSSFYVERRTFAPSHERF